MSPEEKKPSQRYFSLQPSEMAKVVSLTKCPKCGIEMVTGFLATRQGGGSLLFGGMKCSKIWFCGEFKMGFLGAPKGTDVSTKNSHKKYMAIPAACCAQCKIVLFEY